eukprot:6187461-Amphidinium_carterae.1
MPLLGSATHVDVPQLRWFFLEGYTLAVVEVQGRTTEPTDGGVHRNIPVEEKSTRLDRLAKRLPGLRLDCGMEPSHYFIDVYAMQMRDKTMKYVCWEECLSRGAESHGDG